MAAYDYLVATVAVSNRVEATLPVLLSEVKGGDTVYMHGYRMTRKDSLAIGCNSAGNRLMVVGTGYAANAAAAALSVLRGEDISIARLDIQDTVAVDNADGVITFTTPNDRYKASRWFNVGARGSTLYIGAPSSDARMRIYNKSAESGILPDGGMEYLRVEVQLRNRYADQAYAQSEVEGCAGVLMAWLKRFVTPQDYQYFAHLMEHNNATELMRLQDAPENWIARRKRWVESSVMPALKRLIMADPDYAAEIIRQLSVIDNAARQR